MLVHSKQRDLVISLKAEQNVIKLRFLFIKLCAFDSRTVAAFRYKPPSVVRGVFPEYAESYYWVTLPVVCFFLYLNDCL